MASSEWQRLDHDLRQDVALRAALGEALPRCRGPEEAAALLQGQGYAITAEELSGRGAALPDEALDGLSGGSVKQVMDTLFEITTRIVPALRFPTN